MPETLKCYGVRGDPLQDLCLHPSLLLQADIIMGSPLSVGLSRPYGASSVCFENKLCSAALHGVMGINTRSSVSGLQGLEIGASRERGTPRVCGI